MAIENHCIIGANAVILSDTPNGTAAVCVPTMILRPDGT